MLYRLLAAAGGRGGFTVRDMTELGWVNVQDHGAIGDGSVDDTSAISAAISALPDKGVLYFPPGTYKTSGGFTIDKPCTILGMGGAPANDRLTLADPNGGVTVITCTGGSANLFTVTSNGVTFESITFLNTAGSTPTAGAAIATATNVDNTAGNALRILNCTTADFFIGFDILYGCWWHVAGCFVWDPVTYGIRIQNLNSSTGFGGEFTLESTCFVSGTRTTTSAIAVAYHGGSGGKMTAIETVGSWSIGIDIRPDAGMSGFLDPAIITGCMLNGIRDIAINILVASGRNWHNVIITGCHLNPGNDGVTPNYCIAADASGGGTLTHILVTNCSLNAETASSGAAIALNTVTGVRVTGCLTGNYSGGVVSQASCSDVVVTASA